MKNKSKLHYPLRQQTYKNNDILQFGDSLWPFELQTSYLDTDRIGFQFFGWVAIMDTSMSIQIKKKLSKRLVLHELK